MRILTPVGLALLSISAHCFGAAVDNDAINAELKTLANQLKYQSGVINLRDGLATIHLPDSFRYIDPTGTETLLNRIWRNPPSEKKPLGTIVPTGFDPFSSDAWCVIISYEEDGYVKDDDAEKIDYASLLTNMKASAQESSAERVKRGYPPIELVGWAAAPRYDRETHKFYWAKEIKFDNGTDGNTLNYNLRILGRRGILVLNAVSEMSQFPRIEKSTPEILGMIDFNPGNRYADYKPGVDKMAAYGLAALVAGGVAAKAGLFKGLLVALLAMKKFLIIGVIAVVAFVKRLLGKKSNQPTA